MHTVQVWQATLVQPGGTPPRSGVFRCQPRACVITLPCCLSPQLLELLALFYYEFTELEVHVCIQFMFLLARWALVCCYLGRTFVYVCGHFTFWTQFCLPAAWVSGHRARSLLALSFYQGDSFPLQPHCPAGVIRLSGPGSTSFSWFPGGLGRHWRCLYCLQAQQLQTCSSRVQLSGEKLAGQL